MKNNIIRIYKDFIKFYAEEIWENSKSWFGRPNISKKEFKKNIFPLIKPTFVDFYNSIKILHFLGSEKLLLYFSNDLWDVIFLSRFLLQKNLGKFYGGKITELDEKIKEHLIVPLNYNQIKSKIEKKLKIKLGKILNKACLLPILKKYPELAKKYKIKEQFDQLPLSLDSIIKILEKISFYFPFKEKFAVVGADDFIQIYLNIIYPEMEIFTYDIDDDLLKLSIEISRKISKENKIKYFKADFTKHKIKKETLGFYTNPPYTLPGATKFLKFGLNGFSKLGGFSFLVLGDDAIGNRSIEFQKFLTKNKLSIEEISKNYFYPIDKTDKEAQELLKQAKKFNYKPKKYLFAKLYVLSYIPFKLPKFKYKDIFFYL
jgi:predicted methyltransferase